MPLPLLFIGAAVLTGGVGAGKTVKAGVDANTASRLNKTANDLVQESSSILNRQRKACGTSLQKLGEEKLFVLNTSITDFLNTFTKIKNVDFKDSAGLEELSKLQIDQQDFEEMEDMVSFAGNIAGGAIAGTAGGALVAFGAYGAAQALACASTGTAIATLSGAAASNATLAFFGGGAIAAGGWGMAGGAAVLGGIVAGPALLVLGFVAGSAANKNLNKAYTNKAEAERISEELSKGSLQCEAIRRRTYMFYNLLARLDAALLPMIYRMEDIVKAEGEDYRAYSIESKKAIASCVSTALSVKAVLDTPLLTEEGSLTEESGKLLEKISR